MAIGYNTHIVLDGLILANDQMNGKSNGATFLPSSGQYSAGTTADLKNLVSDEGDLTTSSVSLSTYLSGELAGKTYSNFNGSNSKSYSSNLSSLNVQGPGTLCFWCNPDSVTNVRTIAGLTDDSSAAIYVGFRGNNLPGVWRWNNASTNTFTSSPLTGSPVGKWINICITFNTNNLKGYINGELGLDENAFANQGNTGGVILVNGTWGSSGNTDWYDGKLGVTLVYNRVLSEVEIQQNFNAYRARYKV